MTNSDNLFGVFNKKTCIYSQVTCIDIGHPYGPEVFAVDVTAAPIAPTNFASVAEAKSWFFTDAALAVHDECCTQLQWALVGTTGLKVTMAFGTKGVQIAAADDWSEQYNSRKASLLNSNNWAKHYWTFTETSDHLF